jgi:HK97 family phage prohead protease
MPNREYIEKLIGEKISKGREYRRVSNIAIRSGAEGDPKIVEGYATTFDEEYCLFAYGNYRFFEKIDSHAFDGCDMSDVIMQYDHAGRVFARSTNGTLKLTVDQKGLAIEADLGGTTLGEQLYEEIRGGYTTKMSFGFIVGEDKREEKRVTENGATVYEIHRTITKLTKLYDVSAVSIPANDTTEISARSWCDGVIAELEAERLRAEEREAQIKKIKILTM